MNRTQIAWMIGRPFFGGLVRIVAPLRAYGRERIPLSGPAVPLRKIPGAAGVMLR